MPVWKPNPAAATPAAFLFFGDHIRMNSRTRKFLSYYRPYKRTFEILMCCALLVAATALIFPLCTRYITKNVLEGKLPGVLPQIYRMGAVMLALIALNTLGNFFVDYRGHAMGAMMESDMRSE